MSAGSGRRLWGGITHLTELLEEQPGGMEFAARDFALVTLAGELAAAFPGQLVFKGGFVLRHGYGHPFYEPFEILTMDPGEMAAEKLRTLAQRQRATDLADLAVLLRSLPATSDERIARYAVVKFH